MEDHPFMEPSPYGVLNIIRDFWREQTMFFSWNGRGSRFTKVSISSDNSSDRR